MPVTTFNYFGSAVFIDVVSSPSGGYQLAPGVYDIAAFGGQGGGSNGGLGAKMEGTDFNLVVGERLELIIGGPGASGDPHTGFGGGGGSFVIVIDDGTNFNVNTPLVIAGGGGGGAKLGIANGGVTSGTGQRGSYGGLGGQFGAGGDDGGYAGGGGGTGLLNDALPGSFPPNGNGGTRFAGGSGGFGYARTGGHGGFGGGGGGGSGFSNSGSDIYGGGGGGGGYSGGGGGAFKYTGGGGGSFDSGTYVAAQASENVGFGRIVFTPLCYLRGTHILTPTGTVFVEDLNIGDLVVTRFSGIQPVKWIGRQSYDSRFIQTDRDRIPVCVRAGALGDRLPAHDLYISPGHSMLVDGRLVLASSLVNGVTITQEWSPVDIDYFQIELESHDCVISEGAWSETYADGPGLRDQFHNAAEFAALYPDHAPPDEVSLCAPRPERGAKLDAVLRHVVARADASLTPGPLRGSIDRIAAPWTIEGWANDADHPELPVLLEVVLNDRVIATTLACDYRRDLAKAGIGRGRCAFFLKSPTRLPPEMLDTLRIRRASDHAELGRSLGCVATAPETTVPTQGLRLVA